MDRDLLTRRTRSIVQGGGGRKGRVAGWGCGVVYCVAVKKDTPDFFSFPVFRSQFCKIDWGGLVQSYVATNKPLPKLYSKFWGHEIFLRSLRPPFPLSTKNKKRIRRNNPEGEKKSLSIFKFLIFTLYFCFPCGRGLGGSSFLGLFYLMILWWWSRACACS